MFSPRDFQPESSAPVVFLAGAASEPSDWTWLAEYIGGHFRVAAPDVRLNNRATPAEWLSAADAAFLREAQETGGQINIVAHGPGAIPALRFCKRNPGMVRSLTLVDAIVAGGSSDIQGFRSMAESFQRFCAEGDAAAATGWHTDYWHGKGAWAKSSAGLRQSMAFRTGATRRDIEAVLSVKVSDQELASIGCPVMLIDGENATVEAKEVSKRLSQVIPFAQGATMSGTGHMSHITAPHVTHPLIREFLVRIAQHWHDSAVPMAMAA